MKKNTSVVIIFAVLIFHSTYMVASVFSTYGKETVKFVKKNKALFLGSIVGSAGLICSFSYIKLLKSKNSLLEKEKVDLKKKSKDDYLNGLIFANNLFMGDNCIGILENKIRSYDIRVSIPAKEIVDCLRKVKRNFKETIESESLKYVEKK